MGQILVGKWLYANAYYAYYAFYVHYVTQRCKVRTVAVCQSNLSDSQVMCTSNSSSSSSFSFRTVAVCQSNLNGGQWLYASPSLFSCIGQWQYAIQKRAQIQGFSPSFIYFQGGFSPSGKKKYF